MVDPSHGTGKASLVATMARAAVAAGADGLNRGNPSAPEKALSERFPGADAAGVPADDARLRAKVAEAVGMKM